MMRKIIVLFFLILLGIPLSASGDVIVLCYHTFLGKTNQYDISKEVFKNQIESIKKLGYTFVSFEDIVNGNVKNENQVLITIDDGNISIPEVYDEILKPNGIKPILAIYPNPIMNKHPKFMTFDTLQQYVNAGAAIASHGFYHLFINSKLYSTKQADFMAEIYKSKDVLEKKLPVKITVFVYPFGLVTDVGKEHLKKASYRYAFSLNEEILKVPLELNNDPYNLPRYMVTKNSWKYIYTVLQNHAPNKGKVMTNEKK